MSLQRTVALAILFLLCLAGAARAQDLCYPACRAGYFCARGQCISACNPACPGGTECTDDGQCVVPQPPQRDVQADGGATFSGGIEPSYTMVYYSLRHERLRGDLERPFSAFGHAFSLMGALEVDYGFGEHVYLGFRFALGRMINSDDSTGSALRMVAGPTLLLRPARPIYIGIDVLLSILSFDDLPTTIDGYPRGMDPNPSPELDGETIVSLSGGLRLGFVLEITNQVAFTPELRFDFTPFAIAKSGADAFFSETGSGTVTYTPDNVMAFSAGLFLGSRFFL